MHVLYLDYDNVLHGEVGRYVSAPHIRPYTRGEALFEHAPVLDALLTPYPNVRIVLSTSWVRVFDYYRARKRLPPALKARVIGATFHARHMRKDEFSQAPRYAQILADVSRRRPAQWLAIDDDVEGWPEWALPHLIATEESVGLNSPEVQAQLQQRLAQLFGEPSAG
jgi:hypothetical protein